MAYIKTITVGDTPYNLSLPQESVGSGLTINEIDDNNVLSINLGNGLQFDNNQKIAFKPSTSSGITCDENGVSLKVNSVFEFTRGGYLDINLGSGLKNEDNDGNVNLHVNLGNGLEFSDAYGREGSIDLKNGYGITFDNNGAVCWTIRPGTSLLINSDNEIVIDTNWLTTFINNNFNPQPLL